jgi:hypothetical protein
VSPPLGRRKLDGLKMSDEGDLEDVAEFFRAAACCSWRLAIVTSIAVSRRDWASNSACWALNLACKREQFGQDFRAFAFIARYAKAPAAISLLLYR